MAGKKNVIIKFIDDFFEGVHVHPLVNRFLKPLFYFCVALMVLSWAIINGWSAGTELVDWFMGLGQAGWNYLVQFYEWIMPAAEAAAPTTIVIETLPELQVVVPPEVTAPIHQGIGD